jgi:hypothetical protein
MLLALEGEANRIGFSPVTKLVELGEHSDRETIHILNSAIDADDAARAH